MEDAAMAAPEVRDVKLNCIVVGIPGESVSIDIELNARVKDLKEPIKTKYQPALTNVNEGRLLLFLAKKADGTWLSADPAFEETELKMATGETPEEINHIISDHRNWLSGRKTLAKALGNAIPPPEHLHLLVKITRTTPSTAVPEYNDITQVSRKRGAEAMEDSTTKDATMEDVAMEAATMEDVVMAPDVVRVNCIVVGVEGQSVGINIKLNAMVGDLKAPLKLRRLQQQKDVGADNLLIFPAKKVDGTWLSADPAFKEAKLNMVTGAVPDEINRIISDEHMMIDELKTIAVALGSANPPRDYVHLLVKAPLPEGIIKEAKSSVVSEYRRIAHLLKTSKEVEAVVQTLKDVNGREEEPMPFVVLENSSGTGKTQMAFNLEAHGAFDVFYLPCTPLKDVRQQVYQAFRSRQVAFEDCMTSDIKDMEGDGSVVEFGKDANKRLKVYAFIIAALGGDNTFMGDALLQDVNAALKERSKPIVFFLDEFPHVRKNNQKLVRSMRNVFRFLRLPLIISSTNDTARTLFTVSGYSRPSSGDPIPWCMVVPSLPTFAMKGIDPTSVFGWIIQHSRPLFGALAQEYMDQFPYDGQNQLRYLTGMVRALTPKFRGFKSTKRANEFRKGQLYLFLGASYNADEELTILSGENDEKYIPKDGKRTKDSDEDMPEAGCDESTKKEVNLIDGHYGRMEEQKNFELQLGQQKELLKNNKVWKCRCVFPRLEDDILLYLTLMGDYDDTDAQGSRHHRQQALPNNKWSPLDLPFWKKLRDTLGQNGTSTCNAVQDTNDEMGLEALAVGAVILASHQGGFYGINFEAFLGRLLYELGVRDFIAPVAFLGNAEIKKFTVPFLSPPNVAWPKEFTAFWKNTRAQFASIRQSHNGDRMEIQTQSGVLSGECKDRQKFTLSVLKRVLEATPSPTKIHLVVVKRLQGSYFTKSELVAEPKDSARTPASSKTKKTEAREKKTEAGRENESASEFLERIKLQHAKFYRTSRDADGRLEEFPELMQARRDPPLDDTSSSPGGKMMGKTIIFIEVGNWR